MADLSALFEAHRFLLMALEDGGHDEACPLRCITADCDHDHHCVVCDEED